MSALRSLESTSSSATEPIWRRGLERKSAMPSGALRAPARGLGSYEGLIKGTATGREASGKARVRVRSSLHG